MFHFAKFMNVKANSHCLLQEDLKLNPKNLPK